MPFAGERSAALDSQARRETRRQLLHLTPHERHRKLIDDYARFYGKGHPQQPAVVARTDADVLREHHRFIREADNDADDSWEQRLAAKYCSKLFKEYCIADLSLYKQQRIGLRWRTESEVMSGKGQFVCGAKRCDAAAQLASYEVNFAYEEAGEQKNALVKLRVCPECARKLNHKREHALRRAGSEAAEQEARAHKRRRADDGAGAAAGAPAGERGRGHAEEAAGADASGSQGKTAEAAAAPEATEAEHWGAPVAAAAEPSREEEFDAYFAGARAACVRAAVPLVLAR